MKRHNLTGEKFGRLLVLKEIPTKGYSSFLCKCECGKEVVAKGTYLKKGKTKSCGCLQKDIVKEKMKTHGYCGTRIYRIWKAIKTRCTNRNFAQHKDYFDRGIILCKEWKENFISFYNWAMGNGYNETLSIDRIDNNKGYSPENCRWTDRKIQNRNSRNCVIIEYLGNKLCLSEWEEKLNLRKHCLAQARYKGENVIDIIKRNYNEAKQRKD